jgi:predicted component of type VI protein secretion system
MTNILKSATVFVILAVFLCAGCSTAKQTSNPLEGWKSLGSAYVTKVCPFGQTVKDDYQSYARNLSPEERRTISDFRIEFFENESGQRAVTIKVDLYGTFGGKEWTHVLIYDKANIRTKTLKYVSRRFLS